MKEVTKEVYLKWYEDMLLWRKFEDKLGGITYTKKVRGSSLVQWPRGLQEIACNGFDKR
jgi:TPP-dependent pyruvate/acetoin dehydrogenase alpha subunit